MLVQPQVREPVLSIVRLPDFHRRQSATTPQAGSELARGCIAFSVRWTCQDVTVNSHVTSLQVNGQPAGWFILDTGASGLVIERDAADRLGLSSFGEVYVAGVGRKVRVCIQCL